MYRGSQRTAVIRVQERGIKISFFTLRVLRHSLSLS